MHRASFDLPVVFGDAPRPPEQAARRGLQHPVVANLIRKDETCENYGQTVDIEING